MANMEKTERGGRFPHFSAWVGQHGKCPPTFLVPTNRGHIA